MQSVATAAAARRELGSRLVSVAEDHFDIPEGAICNPARRNGRISKARWAVTHVLMTVCGWSEPKVAHLFNGNASSINHGKRRAIEEMKRDEIFFEAVQKLSREVAP